MTYALVVMVMGMAVFTASYPSREACMRAGKLKALELAASGKMGATYTCTPIKIWRRK